MISIGTPAFPGQLSSGMSLRDYFAAKAMQGILTATADDRWSSIPAETISNASYEIAEREK